MKRVLKLTKNSVITYLLAVVCAFSSSILFSSRSYASANINVTSTGGGLTCMSWVNPVNLTAPTCNAIQNSTSDLTGSVDGINVTINGTYYSDSLIELRFTFYRVSNSTSLHSIVNGVRQDNSINTGWEIIGYEFKNFDTNTGELIILFKHNVNSGNFNARLRGDYGTLLFALMPSDRIVGANYTIYAVNDPKAGSQAIVDAVNSMPNYSYNLNTINNSIGSVNNNLNQVNNNLNDLKDKQDQANQDANDRYEDEKQTINDAVDSAGEDATSFSPSFHLSNPFRNLLSGYTDSCSVSYPTIASWLHLTKSSHQSWWCKSATLINIRTVLTSVFSVIASLIVFVMVWKWLTKPTGESS